ncbi:phosphoenolpyruvate synthase [bacterium]|uniref:Phosphoenolpyruvate synthase n=2 Tax=Katanobacteria TaxID=422282 RepID=A0A2M7X1F9_UNCKA|nr:phosphoenolpyruvate synthase [bacterium]PIP56661.1 MAG: phosphoenolpyruvate synthase [candidate division WWE3 bacterium CG22_combo_CG10-13_8_21_14_all_39_12]PJA40002.1 MAG: phosphoenolpyruvate synthase [candidate division WWE3 bacterium CG_4_9_14_3_um_filter_39_7]
MPQENKFIAWFKDVGKDDVGSVGGKGANLGEMTQQGFPVPNGFIVTAQTYFTFIKNSGLEKKIRAVLDDLDVNDSKALEKVGKTVRTIILSATPEPEIKNSIITAYKKLSGGKPALVAIRSSATAEDLPEASFAGQQESYMNIYGEDNVVKTIQMAWSSLFEDRAIFYRAQQGFDHMKVGIAVPVQIMVASESSGVMFTADPISNDTNVISIEGAYGYGDAVVSGSITPDQYRVDKKTMSITDKQVVEQTQMLAKADNKPKDAKAFREGSELFWVPVSKAHHNQQKITDENILDLAKTGVELEQHYGRPQDVEWAVSAGTVYITQTRPITTITVNEDTNDKVQDQPVSETNDRPHLLDGLGASPGIAIGPVRNIKDSTEIDHVKKGEVLVTDMTTPDFVPAMRRAVAVVTNLGGVTSHAAIVSRELGIPAVVGTEVATTTLKTGETVTVDGKNGVIYDGVVELHQDNKQEKSFDVTNYKTATKVYCNLGEPQLAAEMATRDVDGVGLLRAEFMIANIGEHPRYMLENGKREEYIDKLYDGIMNFTRAFDPRPVIYRTTDFRTNEYRGLKGGLKFEAEEENPMIGFRGVSRYIADAEVFKMELEAIKKVRRYHQNLWVMLPFVRTPDELREAKKIMSSAGLHQSGTLKLFIMVEVPSTVIMLDKFIGVGIDGVSIGSNDLTQLILGVDRDNSKLADLFDERNPAVLWAIEKTIKTCREHGIMSGICGQAPSQYPELVAKLVEWGVSSISVSPDVIDVTRELVVEAEINKIKQLKSFSNS